MKCWICNEAEATESHHLYPIHLGGPTDGQQINICGNCHSFAHQSAEKLFSGKALDGKLRVWYDRFARGRKTVVVIVKAMIAAENLDLGDSLVPITFKIPRKLRDRLHIQKQDKGATNLNHYIIGLIVKDLGGSAGDTDLIIQAIKKG